ncbi:HEAT repeat domain-containing protein [Chloroflexus sp.]|uniref:HEAT repeat domain-containing protein n=1 Tax=Chloroflexus sp. TaxID=1904827 RepID=UPI002ADD66FD|nr:HEAT repeat domain-containing protein [Chloroflexus sp.]
MSERSAKRPELHFVPRALRDIFLPRRLPREVRSTIEQWLEAEPLHRVLPGALDLPFAIDLDPASILADTRHLALLGPPASGRSLALARIAHRWLASQATVPLIRLLLSEIDTPSLTPRAIVVRTLARRNLAPNPLEHNLPCLLLIDDWEDLPLARRSIWQRFLTSLSERWPQARAVITLPPGELWPGFRHHALSPLSSELLSSWLQILFPHTDTQTLLPLFERDPLILLRERPAELIMLALTQPLSGWPVSRAALYERIAAFAAPILATSNDQVGWRIGYSAYRVYQQALTLAAQPQLDATSIRNAGAQWRALCLPLTFGITPDPLPLITALTEANIPTGERLFLLARALRERPRLDPGLSRPILEELCQYGGEALNTLVPALPVILIDIGRTQPAQVNALLEQIVGRLAPTAATRLLTDLLDAGDAPPALRWQAIDLLCQRRALPPPLPPHTDLIGQAGRCLLAVVHSDTLSWLAHPSLQLGLRLLLSGAAGEERQQTIAHHLLHYLDLPASVRALAPAALPLTDLAQAAADSMAEVRQAARSVWLRSGHVEQLARFVTQPHQPWLARDEALTDLATHPAGATLLAGFALSQRLTLDLRLRAIRLLHHLSNGLFLLKRLLQTETEPVIVRAAAAYQLTHYPQAVSVLTSFLSPHHPPLLRRAAGYVLGQIAAQNHPAAVAARTALIQHLHQPDIDTGFTITIINVPGLCGSRQALSALGHIITPTFGVHLLDAWLSALPALIGPVEQWFQEADDIRRAVLADLFITSGTTIDSGDNLLDRPSALIALQVLQIRSAAVRAINLIGRQQPALEPAVRALFDVTLLDSSAPRPFADLLGIYATNDLVHIARNATDDPLLRSAALNTIAGRPDGTQALLQLARQADINLACTALDQVRPPFSAETIEMLLTMVGAENPEPIRFVALHVLGRGADPSTTSQLMNIINNEEESATLRAAALDAIASAPIDRVIELMNTQPDPLRSAALRALSRSDRPAPINLLHRMAFDADRACGLAAVNALATQIDTTAPILMRIVRSHPDLTIRLAAAAALRDMAGPEAVTVFVEGLLSPYPALQTQAFALLAAADPQHPLLRQVIIDPKMPDILRLLALQHLCTVAPADAIIREIACDTGTSERLRCFAIRVLAQQTDEETVACLARLASDPGEQSLAIRHAAITALTQQCQDFNTCARGALTTLATSAIPEVALWAGTALLDCLALPMSVDAKDRLQG